MDPVLIGRYLGPTVFVLFWAILLVGGLMLRARGRNAPDATLTEETTAASPRGWGIWHLLAVAAVTCGVLFAAAYVLLPWATRPRWQSYTSQTGRYTVSLPAQPYLEQGGVDTGGIPQASYAAIVDRGRWGTSYAVHYSDFPTSVVKRRNPEALLHEMRDQAIVETGAILIKSSSLRSPGPGMDFLLHQQGYGDVRARLFLVGNRVYYLWAGPITGPRVTTDVATFFESFTVTP
jgi:hypothetical protein